MDIRELKPTSRDVYESFARIGNTVFPTHPATVDYFYDNDRREDDLFVLRRFVATVDGEDVAIAQFEHMEDMHDPQRFLMEVMVLPEHRNQGIGGKFYDYLVDLVKRDYDANELHLWTTEDRLHSIRFLQKRGYQQQIREWESRLFLADFDDSIFGDWRGRLAEKGITIKSWTALQADDPDYAHRIHHLKTLIDDAVPTSHDTTEVPFETWINERSDDNVDFLPDAYYIAIHEGNFVGLSNLWGNQGTKNLYVGLTGVLPEQRRKGIALALKIETCVWAKAQGYEQIITWNEINNPMFDLNVKLGFIKQPADLQFVKRLDE